MVTRTGFAFSVMTEFIENPEETPTKQDCELKAFYRLAERLKQRFPRLPICLLLDGLYAGGPTFTRCKQYDWQFLITLQDDDLPSLQREFKALLPLAPENHLHFTPSGYPPVQQEFHWLNDLDYVDTEHRAHTLAVIACDETKPVDGQPQTTRFQWVTSFKITAQKVIPLANQGGRLRWKIENEGFNVQKTGGLRAGTRLHSKPHRRQNLLLSVTDRPSAQPTHRARQSVSARLPARRRLGQEPRLPAAGSLAQFTPDARRDLGPRHWSLSDSLRLVLTGARHPALAPFFACPHDRTRPRGNLCTPIGPTLRQAPSTSAKNLAQSKPILQRWDVKVMITKM